MSTARPTLMGHLIFDGRLRNAVSSKGFAVLRAKRDRCEPHFLFTHLLGDVVDVQLQALLVGSNYPAINGTDVRGLRVICPPTLEEQRAIAAVLMGVDALIGSLMALLTKKRDIRQAASQQLLTGRMRLPGFGGEWKDVSLGDIAQIRNGSTPRTTIPEYWDGGIAWCTPTDITKTRRKYLRATFRYITIKEPNICGATLLPVGALLLCSRATVGEVKVAATPVATNQGFKSVACEKSVCHEYVYYCLFTLKDHMSGMATGSTSVEIVKRNMAIIRLSLFTLSEQRAIATVLSDMDEESAAPERRLAKTRALKQGMRQQLLNGLIRLPIPDSVAESGLNQ